MDKNNGQAETCANNFILLSRMMKVQGDVPDEDAKMGVTTKTKQKPRNQFHQSRIHLCSAATKSSELLKIKSA